MMKIIKQVKIHEGFSGIPYLCTNNCITIGYGRNLDSNPFSREEIIFITDGSCFVNDEDDDVIWYRDYEVNPLTEKEASYLLQNDLTRVSYELSKKIECFHKLSDCRKAVLINMGFQMGIKGLMNFKQTLYHIRWGEFENASKEMLDSKWFREDSPNRALELSEQMRTGKWKI